MTNTTTTISSSFQVLDPIIETPPGTNQLGYLESGLTQLVMGQQTTSVVFQVQKAGSYSFVEAEIINTADTPPLILDFELTNETLNGFTIQLNGLPDTSNSYFKWLVQVPPPNIPPLPPSGGEDIDGGSY